MCGVAPAASEAFTRRVLSLPASSRRLARAGARVEEIDALPPAEAARRGAERAAAATLLEAARQRDSAGASSELLLKCGHDFDVLAMRPVPILGLWLRFVEMRRPLLID